MPITLNGSGTITGISAGGLPDAIITQPELATGVAGTGPAFSAYVGTNQTINNSTLTKIQFNTENFDTNNNFDSTTNYRFTPTVAGYYQINGTIALGGAYAQLSIYKNGSSYLGGGQITSAYSGGSQMASALVYCNGSTDYIEFYAYQAIGGGGTVTLFANSSNSQVSGVLVRSA
jgi:hypothetical protein